MMPRRALVLALLVALLLSGCGDGQPAATPTIPAAEPTQAATSAPMKASEAEGEGTATAGPTAAATETANAAAPDPAARTFRILPEESEARFRLGEILAGRPNQVVGTTQQVEGSFSLNLERPRAAIFEPIRIQADSFQTDDSRRDRAISRFIFQTGRPENQVIEYQIRDARGLAGQVEGGATYPVEVSGDLTIAGTTRSATFRGEVSAPNEERVEGGFETVVSWAEYGLSIPQVPSVADVDEEVTLTLEFGAVAQ